MWHLDACAVQRHNLAMAKPRKRRIKPVADKPLSTTNVEEVLTKRTVHGRTEQASTPPQRATPASRLWTVVWSWSLAALSVVAGIASLLVFRQEITVDPYVSYNASDPFGERFAIVNNGPSSTYQVHYTCAATFLQTNNPSADETSNRSVWIMIPIVPHITKFGWKETKSTDCDYIARFGASLQSVHIEINVFYKRMFWPFKLHTPGNKFVASRDSTGRFLWDHDSSDTGPFDPDADPTKLRPTVLMPFPSSTDPCLKDPKQLKVMEDIAGLVSAAHL